MLWNFADVFCTEWRCAYDLDINLWLFFLTFLVFFFFFFTWNAIKVYGQLVPCGCNSFYSFAIIVLKLCRCFLHGMKICKWFGYNSLIILFYLFCFVNLVFFWYEMLSKCIDSGYIVGAVPLTVFNRLFWNFADIFCIEWRCAYGFGIKLKTLVICSPFPALWT